MGSLADLSSGLGAGLSDVRVAFIGSLAVCRLTASSSTYVHQQQAVFVKMIARWMCKGL